MEDYHSIYLADGTHLESEEARTLHKRTWQIFDAACEYSRVNSATISGDLSLLDWVVQFLDRSEYSEIDKERIRQVSRAWGGYVDESVDTQSLRYMYLEEGMEGPDVLMASTYKAVIDYLAKPVLRDATVYFNQEVNRVETVTDGGFQRLKVKTSSECDETFDHVVVSSLTLLQKMSNASSVGALLSNLGLAEVVVADPYINIRIFGAALGSSRST